MAHFSASGDSIASLFIVVRIGFEPCNNYTSSSSFCQIAEWNAYVPATNRSANCSFLIGRR